MDLSEKDKFGLEKSNDDPINYSDWRFGSDLTNPSLSLVHAENPMSVCKGASIDAAPCSSVSMVDSFCPTLWDHHGSQNLSFSETNLQTSSSSSDVMGIRKGFSGASRPNIEKRFDVGWSNPNSMSKDGVFVHQPGTGILPQSLSQFPADSGFIERAARFSCFNGGNFSDMVNPFEISGSMGSCSKSGGIHVPEILSGNSAKLVSRAQSQKSEPDMAEAVKDMTPVDHGVGEGSSMKNMERGIGDLLRGPHEGNNKNGQVSNESDEAEFSGSGQEEPSSLENAVGESAFKALNSKKRRRNTQDIELEQVKGASQSSIETTKENIEQNKKKIEQNPTSTSTKNTGKHAKENSQNSDASKEEYIHIRARRGQATNSHSLAERVRREKISERMKLLQDLVPGCSKVTGKAVMLDEIINYVQSLQRQVEFLSMKLSAVNPQLDFSIEGFLSKDFLQPRGGTSTIGFAPDMNMAHPQLHPTQQGLVQVGLPCIGNSADTLRRTVCSQLTAINGYREPTSQIPNVWDDELHNVVHMDFGSNIPFNSQELNGSLPSGHMKVEL